jgi:threonine/homoserine/homoserine lactone efflux protein
MDLSIYQTSHYWLFFLLVAGIVAVPGMEMAYAMGSSMVNGRRVGFAAVMGSVAGAAVHILVSALGIGLLLQASPKAFNALLLVGALYVAWMGWALLRSPGALSEIGEPPQQTIWRTFLRAAGTNLLNPKAYVFMIAVFPQFLKPQYGSLVAQSLILWLLTAIAQIGIYGAVVLAAAQCRDWLRGSERNQKMVARMVGLMLLATAAWSLATGWL